jgi:hypothetical protein
MSRGTARHATANRGTLPEQSDNLHRLREIVHDATRRPTDPAVQDRLEAEYDAVIDLIDERAAASVDLTLVRHDL